MGGGVDTERRGGRFKSSHTDTLPPLDFSAFFSFSFLHRFGKIILNTLTKLNGF